MFIGFGYVLEVHQSCNRSLDWARPLPRHPIHLRFPASTSTPPDTAVLIPTQKPPPHAPETQRLVPPLPRRDHIGELPLQAQALDKIQAQLNVQSALERALTWGPGYPEIKRVMLKCDFDDRRVIFGDEERNQFRPYLWPEIDDQMDVLVEITSKIARQCVRKIGQYTSS
ncbi:hypothetical protein BKA57DRAFT_508765 [Linnemannia elongata]|nr:hypothetical protein BKA57DRAFT_508765 [Linnemannia elongata]